MSLRNVTIKNKIACAENEIIVCDNSDYVIKFNFDEEWLNYDAKTMVVEYDGLYQEVVFPDDEAELPVIHNAQTINIGVYAGDIHTTTPARFICKRAITSDLGVHDEPEEDVYNQLLELLNDDRIKGATYTPSVDSEGVISWTNDKGKPNPPSANIKGPKGDTGEIVGASASINDAYGVPTVEVTLGGSSTERTFNFNFENLKGNGIVSVDYIGTVGLTKTYHVVYDNGTYSILTVMNGAKGDKGDTGNTYFASFVLDPVTGILTQNNADEYAGPEFNLDLGYLYVNV